MSCSSGGIAAGGSPRAIVFQSWATTGRSPHPSVTAASVSASPTSTSSPPAYAANRSAPSVPLARELALGRLGPRGGERDVTAIGGGRGVGELRGR